jgi:hypothetical protein
MVKPRTARGRDRLASTVLVVLIITSVLQIPPIAVKAARSKARASSAMACLGCCGANCQCAGDCCGDSHVANTHAAGPLLKAAAGLTRNRTCQNDGWLLVTFTIKAQPWGDYPRRLRLGPTQSSAQKSAAVVCLWQRPTVSQRNPRGPPSSANRTSTIC